MPPPAANKEGHSTHNYLKINFFLFSAYESILAMAGWFPLQVMAQHTPYWWCFSGLSGGCNMRQAVGGSGKCHSSTVYYMYFITSFNKRDSCKITQKSNLKKGHLHLPFLLPQHIPLDRFSAYRLFDNCYSGWQLAAMALIIFIWKRKLSQS